MNGEASTSSIFPRTDWGELRKAADAEQLPLERLIQIYWQPLKIFFLATYPNLRDQADVLIQEFAEDKMLKEGWLRKADQGRGRFRDFLKTSLRNFVLDRLTRAEVKHAPVSLQELEQEIPVPESNAEAFDLAWAQAVLSETLKRMQMDCEVPGEDLPRRKCIWDIFRIRLLEPIFNDAPQIPYDELVERFGLKSPMEASNTLLSAKRMFKSHLSKVIEEYAGRGTATATEIKAIENFLEGLAKRG